MENLWEKYFEGKYQEILDHSLKFLGANHVADHLHLTGLSLIETKKIQEGKSLLTAASTLFPEQKYWFANAAVALLERDPTGSLEFTETGLGFHPDNADLYFNKGNALIALNRPLEALESFEKSLSIEYRLDALLNKANCLCRKLERQVEALSLYEEILEKDPTVKSALLGKAICLIDLGKGEQAEPLFETILDVPEAAFLYGIIHLTKGNLKTGWHYYNQRWNCGFAKPDREHYRQPMPDSLDQIRGKKVLLVHEQGNGDSLQFIRFLPMLKEHVESVIVVVPQQLIRLFKRAYPDDTFTTARPYDGYDYEIPMLTQPSLLGIELNNIPSKPYLSSEYLYLRSAKPKVGLCWAGGNATPTINSRRSMRLEKFLPLRDLRIDFVSLQFDDTINEMKELGWQFDHPLKPSFDYLDTANIISGLDLVITVDTSVAHLAAAMGKPTWMLSRYDACWRWLKDREDTPWYPSMRIYRQPPPVQGYAFSKDWDSVIQKVYTDLYQKLNSFSHLQL